MSALPHIYGRQEVLPLPREEASNDHFEKIRAVFHFALDCLLMVWYLLEHAIYWLINDSSGKNRIFKNRVVQKTHNYAKLSDLWSYVKLRRDPIIFDKKNIELHAATYGFTTERGPIWTKPHSGGMCLGGVLSFLKKWLESDNIQNAIDHVAGGVPLEGAIYQEMYSTLFNNDGYLYLINEIQEYIKNYPEKAMPQSMHPKVIALFEGLNACLKKSEPIAEKEMARWVCDWVLTEKNIQIDGMLYASLREAIHAPSAGRDRILATLPLACLQAEILHFDAAPGDVLKALETLAPGAYNFNFPLYEGIRSKKKGCHAVAFVIQKNGEAYFYEPNICVAFVPAGQLQETASRLLEKYTGFDYSRCLEGERPGWLKRISNFFRDQVNPPSTPLTSGIDLLKINLVRNAG